VTDAATTTCARDCGEPATTGHLCQPCQGLVTRALLDTSDLFRHVRVHVRPGTRNPRDDVLREAPAPLTISAVDDADRLHATLHTWAIRAAAHARLTGPQVPRTWVRWDQAGNPVGAISRTDPTTEVAGWLITHTDLLAAGVPDRPAAREWADQVIAVHREVSSRWPREPHARKLHLPCPSCNRLMLHLHPPAEFEHPVTVLCHNLACGRRMTEHDYYWRVQEAKAARRQGAAAP
jgi:hypothetical protein